MTGTHKSPTKLTQTQRMLIAKAQKDGGSVQVEAGGGRGAKGGRISYGSREMAAAMGLVSLGLAVEAHRDTSQVWMGNGNTVHSCYVAIRLTDKASACAAAAAGHQP